MQPIINKLKHDNKGGVGQVLAAIGFILIVTALLSGEVRGLASSTGSVIKSQTNEIQELNNQISIE